MKKIVLLLISVISLFADFKHIDYKDIKTLGKDVVLIDIRTPSEWKETGVVPGSKKIMFFNEKGKYDVNSWLKEFSKYVKDKNQPFVLVCRTGSRTNMVGNFLDKQLGFKNVYDLKGGITFGYLMQGFKTTKKDLKPNPVTGNY